jgi:2TM domain
MSNSADKASGDIQSEGPESRDQLARQEAIKQIERRRRFHVDVAVSTMLMLLVAGIWAISEYNNAGGWPSEGFSQSSSIPHVWNMWILYPLLGWGFYVGVRAWTTYLRKPISEGEITHEIERQVGQR